jgi:hypothetical protein
MVYYGMVYYMVWCIMVWYMMWCHSMLLSGMVWYGTMVWFCLVWYPIMVIFTELTSLGKTKTWSLKEILLSKITSCYATRRYKEMRTADFRGSENSSGQRLSLWYFENLEKNHKFFISTIKFVKYILCLSGLCYHSVRSPAHWKYYHGRKCC